MASTLRQRLDTLTVKAQLLTKRYRAMKEENERAQAEVADLNKRLTLQQQEIAHLRTQIESLTVVTTLNPSRQDVEISRAIIAELVREIDKCINELTQ